MATTCYKLVPPITWGSSWGWVDVDPLRLIGSPPPRPGVRGPTAVVVFSRPRDSRELTHSCLEKSETQTASDFWQADVIVGCDQREMEREVRRRVTISALLVVSLLLAAILGLLFLLQQVKRGF